MARQKILVVEDEFDVCSILQSFFGRRGYDVSVTASGAEALRLIPVLAPDLVLLDLTLEEMNGLHVLEQLRQHDRKTKVLVITGQVLAEHTIENVRVLGVSAYLKKPIVLSSLETLVTGILKDERVGLPGHERVSPPDAGPLSARIHKIVDLLGIIRARCENFVLDTEKGVYEQKSSQEQRDAALALMKDVVVKVDEIIGNFER